MTILFELAGLIFLLSILSIWRDMIESLIKAIRYLKRRMI
jgi:hypothetical protein